MPVILCKISTNSSGIAYEGQTVIVQGVPGVVPASYVGNPFTDGSTHHQGPVDTRVDFRKALTTVQPGGTGQVQVSFNNAYALKGVYWWQSAPGGSGTFTKDPAPGPCSLYYYAAKGKTPAHVDVSFCHDGAVVATGRVQVGYFQRNQPYPDPTLADAAMAAAQSNDTLVGVTAVKPDFLGNSGASLANDGSFKIKPGSELMLTAKAPLAVAGAGSHTQVVVYGTMRLENADGRAVFAFVAAP